ncbi:hypothetical protein PV326_014422 [Microctonus aethiopoides]|nr:hypothetical protein PV326_014422 [Microctonus aethiopoides]
MSRKYNSIRSTSSKSRLEIDFDSKKNLLLWIKRFLIIGGIWPLDKTYVRATIWTIYLTLHLIAVYAELLAVFGDLEAMVLSVLESVMQTMVLTKLIVFRHSKILRKLILHIKEDFNDEFYDNDEEKKIYLKYNHLAKLYFKLSMPYIVLGASSYFFRPIITNIIMSDDSNGSFILPFRTKLFFNLSDSKIYYLTYAYQSPMIYLLICHNAWICVLITIVLHICGQLAILRHRIQGIIINTNKDESQIIFQRIVKRHMRAIWMAKKMDDTFHFILLFDLVGTTLLLGLMSYVVITGSNMSDSSFGPVYVVCALATILLLYGYCIVGECLIDESNRVHIAFYQCMWYESSKSFRKGLIICLQQTQEPLRITGGKFFVFSLNGFTDVLKTAMGYLSMLRKMSQ